MFVVKVFGGLGNQMFQYAFMLYLKQNGLQSRISFSSFIFHRYHNGFALAEAFKIRLPIWQKMLSLVLHVIPPIYRLRYIGFPVRWLQEVIDKRHKTIVEEKKWFSYDSSLVHSPSGLFIGFWQSIEYLDGLQEILHSHFSFKNIEGRFNKLLEHQIKNCESVCIHIRRGDYMEKRYENTYAIFENLTYYHKAVSLMNEKVANPHFFIFSDDPQWVKQNLNLPNSTYVEHNKGKNSFRDMYLMSLCKHNIIANSTFSWWGAWLNRNPEKIITIPQPWMKSMDCEGIYPKGWIQIMVESKEE